MQISGPRAVSSHSCLEPHRLWPFVTAAPGHFHSHLDTAPWGLGALSPVVLGRPLPPTAAPRSPDLTSKGATLPHAPQRPPASAGHGGEGTGLKKGMPWALGGCSSQKSSLQIPWNHPETASHKENGPRANWKPCNSDHQGVRAQ